MATVRVLKFGGTALGSAARVRHAARHVARRIAAGEQVVVVVSANGHRTDQLLRLAQRCAPDGPVGPAGARELVRLLATGEDASAALFALALRECGVRAHSLRDADAGLFADGDPLAATLLPVDPHPIATLLAAGFVPVVSGFHAARRDGDVVLLGRGSSDRVAIAIAAALRATAIDDVRCDIITDVDGVYERDPRRDGDARRFRTLTFASMTTIAARGDQVIEVGAARLAEQTATPFRVAHWRRPGSATRQTTIGAATDRLLERHAARCSAAQPV